MIKPNNLLLFCCLSLALFVITLVGAILSKPLGKKVLLFLVAGGALFVALVFATPYFVRARVVYSRNTCIANLKQLEGAKATWALEFKKNPPDTPADHDLFGDTRYIRKKPTCPQGGSYRIGTVDEKPTCSLGGPRHSLEP